MTKFAVHTIESAPEASKPLLEKSKQLYGGMIPNIHGVMAESPALLEAYQSLGALFHKTSFTIVEQNIVWLAVNYGNKCRYCMAAHSVVAKHAGVADDDIAALRNGAPLADPKLQALRHFTAHMIRQRGWPDPGEADALLAAGYSNTTILDVVLGIGMKTMSNYMNHVTDTPLDAAFTSAKWP